mmetsp:Transcript_19780/g.51387  ORF Transcript_19780/g.51387 Transcript_19780/m.51387 type:complete len:205 (-) Transcript_19780:530-1144(-)
MMTIRWPSRPCGSAWRTPARSILVPTRAGTASATSATTRRASSSTAKPLRERRSSGAPKSPPISSSSATGATSSSSSTRRRTFSDPSRARTRSSRSSRWNCCGTCPSPALHSNGACRCRATRTTSSTSGSTRSRTTSRPSAFLMATGRRRGEVPLMLWEKTSCVSTLFTGPRCSWRRACRCRRRYTLTDGGPRMGRRSASRLVM